VLDLVRGGAILRRGFDGVEGIDTGEALRRIETRHHTEALQLLEAAEVGVMTGIAERRDRMREGEG
jgi:hypothetical protein